MGLRTESRFGRSEMWSGQAVGPNQKSKPETPKEDIRRDKRKGAIQQRIKSKVRKNLDRKNQKLVFT